MEMTFDRAALKEVMSKMTSVAPQRSPVPQLTCVRIAASENEAILTAKNMNSMLTAFLPADITSKSDQSFLVEAKTLFESVKVFETDTVNMNFADICEVHSPQSKFSLAICKDENLPEIIFGENIGTFSVDAQKLQYSIGKTIFATMDTDVNPVFKGVNFELKDGVLSLVALDGFRLAVRRIHTEGPNISGIISAEALNVIFKLLDGQDTVTIDMSKSHVRFTVDGKVKYTFTSVLLAGKFLDADAVIPKNDICIKANKRELLKLLEKASLMTSEKIKAPLVLDCKSNLISVKITSRIGCFDGCLEAECSGNIHMGLNLFFLFDAIKAADGDVVKIMAAGPRQPVVVVPEDDSDSFTYMVFPVVIQ